MCCCCMVHEFSESAREFLTVAKTMGLLLFFFIPSLISTICWTNLFSLGNCSAEFPRLPGLNGVQVTYAAYHMPPFDILALGPDGNYSVLGYNKQLHLWLMRKINITIGYVTVDDSIIEKYGSTTEYALRLVTNREVDAISVGTIATPERKKKMDFAYVIWTEPYVMVVPRPGEEPRLFAFIRPFQPSVWLLLFVTSVTMVIMMSIFSMIYWNTNAELSTIKKRAENKRSIFGRYAGVYSIYVVSNLTNQGRADPDSRLFFRILVGIWLMISMVLVNSYAGIVISFLTVSRNKPQVNSFEDLATNNEVGLIIREDFVIGQQIMEAKTGILKVLGDQIRNNPNRAFNDMTKLYSRLDKGNSVFPFMITICKFFIVSRYKKEGKCRFTLSDPIRTISAGFFSTALQKDSKFTKPINDALIEVWETGLPLYWVKSITPQAPKCFAKTKSSATSSRALPIGLTDLSSGFFLYGIGVGLAVLTFLMENFHARIYKRRSHRISSKPK